MLEQTKRISSVKCKVEPDLHTGSDQKVPASQYWLLNFLFSVYFLAAHPGDFFGESGLE